jgi:Co/Zn/Cd efflux system component
VLAIAALLMGSTLGWLWLDPAIGILGAVIIAHWSIGVMRGAGAVLVDYLPPDQTLSDTIRHLIERGDELITDLHVWQFDPGHHGALVTIRSPHPQPVSHYRARLAPLAGLSHVTFEIEAI